MSAGRGRVQAEGGMVTAETAVVLPVLLVVLAAAVAVITVLGAQLRCLDAAREGARAAARGESEGVVTRLVGRSAPQGAVTRVARDADDVRVTVTLRVTPVGALPFTVTLSADAVAVREPGGAG